MNGFEKLFYKINQDTWDVPPGYGWFHFMYMALIIIASIVCSVLFRKFRASDGVVRIFLLICSEVMIYMEIIKLTSYSFNYDESTGEVKWEFEWHAFPFQLCSTPMYAAFIGAVVKKGPVPKLIKKYIICK
jgi:hypothetical protein